MRNPFKSDITYVDTEEQDRRIKEAIKNGYPVIKSEKAPMTAHNMFIDRSNDENICMLVDKKCYHQMCNTCKLLDLYPDKARKILEERNEIQ